MHIDDDQMYHGAALIQIAERPEFKAINLIPNFSARGALRINNNIAVHMKYATKPMRPFKEYTFTFNEVHWSELDELHRKRYRVFVVLVCIKAREICCLTLDQLRKLNNERMTLNSNMADASCTVLVTALNRRRFRVSMNRPGRRRIRLREEVVSRSAFPRVIFDKDNSD